MSVRFSPASQRGNALFLILIAVALFAALSYAITQSGRGSGSGISKEQDAIIAAQIVQVGANIKTAVMRMRTSGVAAADIRFHDTGNPAAPCTATDGTCLFTPEGGGATFPVVGKDIPSSAYDPDILGNPGNVYFLEIGETDFPGARVVGAGTDATDGTLSLVGIRKSVCEAINKGLGITEMYVTDADFESELPTNYKINNGGLTEGCFDMSSVFSGEAYQYYTTLLPN